ncbi:MAG TPA: DUF2493 domain-containing protein [Polyangiales bacterium]|nr:DUF2493 domain-containing protein [Polyangiales bacterium]
MTSGLIMLVTGGRGYADREHAFATFDAIHADTPVDLMMHGACGWDLDRPETHCRSHMRGADALADAWARERGVAVERHPARWDYYRTLGKVGAAGPSRNTYMLLKLDEHRPKARTMVVAFPGDRGTADCVRKARRYDFAVRPCCELHPPPPAKP